MRRISVLLSVGVVMAAPAKADVTVTYTLSPPMPGGQSQPSMPAVRITAYADAAGNYRRERMLMGRTILEEIALDGVLYLSVSAYLRPPFSPEPISMMRWSDYAALNSESDALTFKGNPPPRPTLRTEVVDLGAETVAGYSGEHYRIRMWWGDRPANDRDLVLSTDPRFAALVRAQKVTQRRLPPTPENERYYALLSGGAILRDGGMILSRADFASVDPAKFALPGPVLVLEQLRKMFPRAPRMAPPMPPLPAKP